MSNFLRYSLALLVSVLACCAGVQADGRRGDGYMKPYNAHMLHRAHASALNDALKSLQRPDADSWSQFSAKQLNELQENWEGNFTGTSFDDKWFTQEDENGVPFLSLIFLVMGFIFMSVGAVFFLVMAVRYDGEVNARAEGPLFHYLVFFIAAVSALSYYSMWTGTGMMHITEVGGADRTVLTPRYLDWIITTPLILVCIAMFGNAPLSAIVGLVGCDMLMIGCGYMGGVVSPVHKFFWWGAGMIFFIVLIYMLLQELNKATDEGRVNDYDSETLRYLTYLTVGVWAIYPLMWMIGQEGTSSASANTEVVVYTLADLLAKLVFGMLLIFRLNSHEAPARYSASSTFV